MTPFPFPLIRLVLVDRFPVKLASLSGNQDLEVCFFDGVVPKDSTSYIVPSSLLRTRSTGYRSFYSHICGNSLQDDHCPLLRFVQE